MTKPCVRRNDQRVIPDRHLDACIGAGPDWHPPLVWRSCRGCEPCPQRHCILDGRHLEPTELQTCPECLGKVRRDMFAVVDLMVLGLARLDGWPAISPSAPKNGGTSNERPMPGGDLLVILSHGSWALRNPQRALDERPGDPDPIAYELSRHEDDWRRMQHQPAAKDSARLLGRTASYLDQNMGWAAQHHPAFEEFADLLRDYRATLESQLRDGERPDRGVACFECGTTLVRAAREPKPCGHRKTAPVFEPLPADDPRPGGRRYTAAERKAHFEAHDHAVTTWMVDHMACDQGGVSDEWECPRCQRRYDEATYWLAVKAALSDQITA
ncbi:MAG TPA: hypothetical protein VIP06_02910 [Nocardioides sp.]